MNTKLILYKSKREVICTIVKKDEEICNLFQRSCVRDSEGHDDKQ